MVEKNNPADNSERNDSNISAEEKELLESSQESGDSRDNQNLRRAKLDNKDDDGEVLNTDSPLSGEDLDVPGAELDDANESLGEEDEENNSYSQADTE